MSNLDQITSWIFSNGDRVTSRVLFIFGSPHHIYELSMKALEVWEVFEISDIIISGYNGEAEKLGAAIHQLGIPLDNIHLETKARNTLENIRNSQHLIEKHCQTREVHLLMKLYAAPRVINTFKSFFPLWRAQVHHLNLHGVDPSNWRLNINFSSKVFVELKKTISYYRKGDITLQPEYTERLLRMEGWLQAQTVKMKTPSSPQELSPIKCHIISRSDMIIGDLKLVTINARLNSIGVFTDFTSSIVERPDAISVICYDPSFDALVMVRQFRVPHFLSAGKHSTLEIIAGYVDSGESAKDAALRELREETGLIPQRIFPLLSYYPAPTLSTETMHLWCAIVDSRSKEKLFINGGELISTEVLSFAEVYGYVANGGVTDALTIIATTSLSALRPFLISRNV